MKRTCGDWLRDVHHVDRVASWKGSAWGLMIAQRINSLGGVFPLALFKNIGVYAKPVN